VNKKRLRTTALKHTTHTRQDATVVLLNISHPLVQNPVRHLLNVHYAMTIILLIIKDAFQTNLTNQINLKIRLKTNKDIDEAVNNFTTSIQ
jgi:hypothetical protein